MTSADPIGLHDWHAEEYVQHWIGAQRDEERAILLRRLVHLIPFDPDEQIRVLDVGGGYGALTKLVLETYPHASVVLHDYSEPMLTEARDRLASLSDSVAYYRGDLMSSDWTSGLSSGFHAVVSSIAIHNVRHPERIRGVYQEIFPLVREGGCFLNFDQVAPTTGPVAQAERHARLMDERFRKHAETGQWQSLAAIDEELRSRRRGGGMGRGPASVSGELDATLVSQLQWLAEAGFAQVECFWRDSRHVLLGGFRAAP